MILPASLRTWVCPLVVATIVVALAAALPTEGSIRIAALVFIYAIAVTGLHPLMASGQISLGHAGFFAIGAYAVAAGPVHFAIPAMLALLAGMALSGTIAFALGRAALKRGEPCLAIGTLAFGILVAMVLTNEARWTGGPGGMDVPPLTLFRWSIAGPRAWYWLSGASLVGVMLAAIHLMNGPAGRALRALRDDATAASTLGVDAVRAQLLAFVFSAIVASFAGACVAWLKGAIAPADAGFLRSVEFLAMAALGGIGSLSGGVAGAAILTILLHSVPALAAHKEIVLGLILIVAMVAQRLGFRMWTRATGKNP
jgi:branched-chain amino acid transport system permease protein